MCAAPCSAATSEDAYITQKGMTWTLGTDAVERVISLEKGMLITKSLKNKRSGRELSATNSSGPWQFVAAKTSQLRQGELQLDLTLQSDSLAVTKIFVVYPGSSIIREWATIKNTGSTPVALADPDILNAGVRLGTLQSLDFHWMTGGNNQAGSWELQTEKLPAGKARKFDSFDPFPVKRCTEMPRDSVNVKVFLGAKQLWPDQNWSSWPIGNKPQPLNLTTQVAQGEELRFYVLSSGKFDYTLFDPTISYGKEDRHTASKSFSGEQGRNAWSYRYDSNGKLLPLVYDAGSHRWRKELEKDTNSLFIGRSDQLADGDQSPVRVWTAPKAGTVRVTGEICNIRTVDYSPLESGSDSYAPWTAFYDGATREGVFIGWDYFGRWSSSYSADSHGAVAAKLQLSNYRQTLSPGQEITTPRAFLGLFRDDLDNAGNELLDWQYRYLWDYTRDNWFPAIRMLGYWWKGTAFESLFTGNDAQSSVGWPGGDPDFGSTYRKVFRTADLMRYVGADVYHRDWGWWNRAGEWRSPDFRSTGEYLRRSGMNQLIYAFLYTVDPHSKVAVENPDWVIPPEGLPAAFAGAFSGKSPIETVGGTLDMSRPEVTDFIRGQLDDFVARWGDFEWRNDSWFTAARNGDSSVMLAQDQGFRKILQDFLDKYPQSAFQAVNAGGVYGGYDYVRYASTFSFSDGAVGILRNYWASLLFPPDKSSDIPDRWNPDKYDEALWRGLLCINFDMTGDTWDPSKLEGIRELIDIYHYLQRQGVVGRWVRVYRPVITNDDPTMYLQRLSKDAKRGIIIPKRPAPGTVTIKPKGLIPAEHYLVSFHESSAAEKRTGAELMAKGIKLEKMPPGELIYLNLPLHPGSKLDKEAPQPPSNIVKRRADHMGYPGVELEWQAGSDNNWVSYYEVLRNGVTIDKVAKGAFYFDHSAGADLAAGYEIRTVDGAGNVSTGVSTPRGATRAALVFDDASTGALKLSPHWTQLKEEPLVAHAGTISSAQQPGATVELAFEGKRVLWFTKLGAENGKAAVSIDGGQPEIVDTYSADDIWGVGVYSKEFPSVGRHTLRIEVLGQHSERARNALVYLDGIRVEME